MEIAGITQYGERMVVVAASIAEEVKTVDEFLEYATEMSKFLPPEFAGQLAKGCVTKAKEYRKKAERHLRMAEFMEACSAGVNVAWRSEMDIALRALGDDDGRV
jgi:hypothetical protein